MRHRVDTVKKFALSVSVIVLFALYALQKQAQPRFGMVTLPERGAAVSPSAIVASPAAAAWHPAADPSATIQANDSIATPTPSVESIAFVDHAAPATAVPTAVPTTPALAQGQFRDGTYDGGPADANWGEVDVQAAIADGRLQAVRFLQYPNHRGRSIAINQQAMPILTQEAIQAQRADVDVVTGATDTSEAFIQSLGAALQQAAT
jgi:uncharacterized protein with FMN-binding domain